jgi:hypothetical protein
MMNTKPRDEGKRGWGDAFIHFSRYNIYASSSLRYLSIAQGLFVHYPKALPKGLYVYFPK